MDAKVVLVTGGAGFIGSNFLCSMVGKYPHTRFINVDILDYSASLRNVESIEKCANYRFYECSILDQAQLLDILRRECVEWVVHFAAQTHVDHSFGNSLHFTETNVKGTHVLLEACREFGGISKFVHVSTDEVYGEILRDEVSTVQSLLNPTSPYAATKAAAEHICNAYYLSFRMPIIITRGNNVYGKKQYPDKLIPKFILHLLRGEKCPIQGDGSARRSFIHVEDTVRAFETVMVQGKVGQIYNIGSKSELSVVEVLQRLVQEIIPKYAALENHMTYVPNRAFQDRRYSVDATALEQLGWKEQVPFEAGLKQTVEWYRKTGDAYWHRPGTNMSYFLGFGMEGWIGRQFQAHVERHHKDRVQFLVVPKSACRAQDTDEVEKRLMEAKSKYGAAFKGVLCFVGRTSGGAYTTIDYLEDPKTLRENVCDNLFAPVSLALLCQKHKSYCVYLGTGCTFTYPAEDTKYTATFDEKAQPNFFGSAYSVVKVLNVRIRMPISLESHPRDFVTKIKSYAKVIDVPNSVSVLPTLFPALLDMIITQRHGTVNLTNPGTISHTEVLGLYKSIVQPDLVIRTFTIDEQRKVVKADRSNNHLDTTLLEHLYPAVPNARDAVEQVLQHRARPLLNRLSPPS